MPQVKATPLNQFDPSPEVFLVYGRGDLGPAINGNWKMNYTWLGGEGAISGSSVKVGGPSHSIVKFRASLLSPTALQVGIGFGPDAGWRLRTIDVSRFGKITGIWEIGPIFSLDRWIPDVLSKELGLASEPEWLKSFKERQAFVDRKSAVDARTLKKIEDNFRIERPDPKFEYFVDYAVFYGNGPENFDHLSDEFNVPGFLADQKWYIEGNGLAETYSHPGNLTVTLLGMNGAWAMCPIISGDGVDLARHKPPIEFETAFVAAGRWAPVELVVDVQSVRLRGGKGLGQGWTPGVQNIPGQGRRYINAFAADPTRFAKSGLMNIEFDPELPPVAVEGPDAWRCSSKSSMPATSGSDSRRGTPTRGRFSKTLDTKAVFGESISKIGYPCLASFQGSAGTKGWGVGNYPNYQQFLIDYVRFRAAKNARP